MSRPDAMWPKRGWYPHGIRYSLPKGKSRPLGWFTQNPANESLTWPVHVAEKTRTSRQVTRGWGHFADNELQKHPDQCCESYLSIPPRNSFVKDRPSIWRQVGVIRRWPGSPVLWEWRHLVLDRFPNLTFVVSRCKATS